MPDLERSSARVRRLAAEVPERAVIEWEGSSLTYAAFDQEADALADHLQHVDGQQIALCIANPLSLMAAPLAVERAGKTVVSLDATSPLERIRATLIDSEAALLLTDLPGDFGLPTLGPDAWVGKGGIGPVDVERPLAAPLSLNYTSGSTGAPKAIMASEDYLSLIAGWAAGLGESAVAGRVAMFSTGSTPILPGLHRTITALGATLLPYDMKNHGLDALTAFVRDSRATMTSVVPTLVRFWMPTLADDLVFEDLEHVFSWGEALQSQDVRLLQAHLKPGAWVHNLFGQTEGSLISTRAFRVGEDVPDTMTLGLPREGLEVRLLDAEQRPVAPGARGEIAIVGSDLSVGYWRRPEMTAATFRPQPDGRMMILTGDQGELDADGHLVHHGRLDDLVKVSGNRIALGEVESVLGSLPGVLTAVATSRTDASGNVRLLAFVTPQPQAKVDVLGLRQAMSRRLPAYMLPDAIGVLPDLPRLPSGKVDRKGLPDEVVQESDASRPLAPGLEAEIAALFCRVLDRTSVGPDDDFLALGGDSLRAAEMFAAMAAELGHDRPLTLLLEASTPAALATALAHTQVDEFLVPARTAGERPPLFIVHGGKGTALWLSGLAPHIDVDRPLYGLTAPALDGLWPAERSLDELAERYVKAIRQVQPHGPYHLFGYSLGGNIAHAMATSLAAQGEKVAFLGIGDTPLTFERRPAQKQPIPKNPVVLAQAAAHHIRWRLGRTPTQQAAAQWQQDLEASKRGTPVPFEHRSRFVEEVYGRLSQAHVPKSWDGHLTLVQPESGAFSKSADWASLSASIETVVIPGRHFTMVRENASELGTSIDVALRQAAAESATPSI